MEFKEIARTINSYSDDFVKFGPIKIYNLALEILKNEQKTDDFMLSWGGFTPKELHRIKQKRSYYYGC